MVGEPCNDAYIAKVIHVSTQGAHARAVTRRREKGRAKSQHCCVVERIQCGYTILVRVVHYMRWGEELKEM